MTLEDAGNIATLVLGILGLVIAAWATYIGVRALRVSERVESDAKYERQRADAKYRLMCTHDLLNGLRPLINARVNNDEEAYDGQQSWLRSMLAVAGLRHHLQETTTLAERPFASGRDGSPWAGSIEDVDELAKQLAQVREEIKDSLEQQSDRIYANQRLG